MTLDLEPHDQSPLLASPLLMRCSSLLGDETARRVLERLDRELDWQQPSLRLFGRTHPIPRQQVWMGDAPYRYSGQDFAPVDWHADVLTIRQHVERRLRQHGIQAHFNSVLLNRYADGQQRMGWHSDNEPELGPEPVIAAVSLGLDRPLRFRWKHRQAPAFNVDQPHDSLLLMGHGVQEQMEHCLPRRQRQGLRISLTFRWVNISTA